MKYIHATAFLIKMHNRNHFKINFKIATRNWLLFSLRVVLCYVLLHNLLLFCLLFDLQMAQESCTQSLINVKNGLVLPLIFTKCAPTYLTE